MTYFKNIFMAILILIGITFFQTKSSLADDSQITFTAIYQDQSIVVVDFASTSELSTVDPALAADSISKSVVENLFHGLRDNDPFTGNVVPELATYWEVSEDGLVWTFHLRNDVMWYRYDPDTDSAVDIRPVEAGDIEYGIKRTCDPRMRTANVAPIVTLISGCDIVNQSVNPTDKLVFGDTIGVKAIDAYTLTIQLQFPASYFLSITSQPGLFAVPREAIETFGFHWTDMGILITNGPYFLKENTPGVRRVFVRNYRHNSDLDYGGNIDVLDYEIIKDGEEIFALYQDNQLDSSGIPAQQIPNILNNPNYVDQIIKVDDLAVFYFGFNYNAAPFDNVHVRRAFSAILDRNAFSEDVINGRGIPMIHLTPPGIAGAPAVDDIGVGFHAEYARAEMRAAGYPNCKGFPSISIAIYQNATNWADFLESAMIEYLGCPPGLLNAYEFEFSTLLQVISAYNAPEHRPNMWTNGQGPTYNDPQTFLVTLFSCTNDNPFIRPCTEADTLMIQAVRESDPAVREALYTEIEEGFFGPEGEFPIAPLYMRSSFQLVKPWYTGPFDTDGLFGGAHWDTRNLDMAAKTAARG